MENKFLFTVLPINNVDASLIGRNEEIDKIISALDRFQNISIIGDAKIGKSSILKSLEEIIKSDNKYENFIPVYIDLEKFSFNLQTDKLLERILRAIYFQHAELREEHNNYEYSKHDEFSEVLQS
jgi:ABC-type phosphate/phosphonate transport system ATPase subunit